jgi:hypothetical protein
MVGIITHIRDLTERLPGLDISGEKALHAFTQKLLSVLAVRSKARLHRFLELSARAVAFVDPT